MSKDILLLQIEEATRLIGENPTVENLMTRAKLYMKIERRDLAINDLNDILKLDAENVEANSYISMLTEINDYFYNQMYNV